MKPPAEIKETLRKFADGEFIIQTFGYPKGWLEEDMERCIQLISDLEAELKEATEKLKELKRISPVHSPCFMV